MQIYQEDKLYFWLKEFVYKDLLRSKNQMSRWDCYSPSTKHRIELKCRRAHYDTLLLEKNKYDAMIKETSKHLDTPIYINSTPKGIYLFDLHSIEPNWTKTYLRATTDFGNSSRIEKEVMYLNIFDSRILTTF